MTPRRGILKAAALAAAMLLMAPSAAVGQETADPAATAGESTASLVPDADTADGAFGDDAASATDDDPAGLTDAARAVQGLVSPIDPASLSVDAGEEDGRWVISGTLAGAEGTPVAAGMLTFERTDASTPLFGVAEAKIGGRDVPAAFHNDDGELGHDLISLDIAAIGATAGERIEVSYLLVDDEGQPAAEDGTWQFNPQAEKDAFDYPQPEEQDRQVQLFAAGESTGRPAAVNSAPDTPEVAVIPPTEHVGSTDTKQNYGATPYRGPLNDPDFGEQHEQNPGTNTYNDKNYTYPIRHRNWCAAGYGGRTMPDRGVRGPGFTDTGWAGGSDCPVYRVDEQGYFFSRDHVQWAWQEKGKGTQFPAYRADEFLIGGGRSDGSWQGGMYSPSGTNARMDFALNYRRTGKPGFQIFVDGVLNTDDPGWKYVQVPGIGGPLQMLMISPDDKLGVWLNSAAGVSTFNINFLNLEDMGITRSMNQAQVNNQWNKINREGGVGRFRVAIPTPGWTRTVIRVGTTEGGVAGEVSDGNGFYRVNSYNGYLHAKFRPLWYARTEFFDLEKFFQGVGHDEESGRDFAEYDIKVTNNTDLDTGYRLVDRPEFTRAARPESIEVVDGPSGVGWKGVPDQDGQFVLFEDRTLAAGATETYRVRVFFDRALDETVNAELKCTGDPANGLFNRVIVSPAERDGGGNTAPVKEATACGSMEPVEGPEITKTHLPEQSTVAAGGRSGTVAYRVEVTNPNKSSLPVVVTDSPAFADDVETGRLTVDGTEVRPAADGTFPVAGTTEEPVTIEPGATRGYTVVVEWRLRDPRGAKQSHRLQCVIGDDAAGHGFYNAARVTAPAGMEDEADACAPIEVPDLPAPKIEKTTDPEQTSRGQISYEVTVTNPADVEQEVEVTDRPVFAEGLKISSVLVDGSPVELRDGAIRLADAGTTIPAGGSLRYRVTVDYSGRVTDPETAACTATAAGAGQGLFNEATVAFDGDEASAWACDDVPSDRVDIAVAKTDTDGNALAIEADHAFEIHDAETGELVASFTRVRTLDGESYLSTDTPLEPGRRYLLIETRAPHGFELMPAPVAFEIAYPDSGAEVTLAEGARGGLVTVGDSTVDEDDSTVVLLQVADVRKGTLPESGGAGVAWWFVAALGLFGLAAFAYRRRA